MKKSIAYILALFFCVASQAQVTEDLFQKANREYTNKQYERALTFYQKIEKTHNISPVLYYNMGNSYFRLSDYASAILYYERGLRLAPNDENLNTNLKVAKARLKGDLYTIPDFVLVRYWKGLSNLFNPFVWLWVSLILLVLCCVVFVLYYFSDKHKIVSFYVFLSLLLLFTLSIFCGISRQKRLNNHNEGIVFAEQCIGKDSPDDKSTDKVRIYKGSKVIITDRDSDAKDWIRVQTTDGKQAWIRFADIKII